MRAASEYSFDNTALIMIAVTIKWQACIVQRQRRYKQMTKRRNGRIKRHGERCFVHLNMYAEHFSWKDCLGQIQLLTLLSARD